MSGVNGGSFSQPSISKYDGDYDHWSMVMENLLRSKEYWVVVEIGFQLPAEGEVLTAAQQKVFDDLKLKDLKVKNYLFQSLDSTILKTISQKETSKQLWDSMRLKCQGNARVKRAQLNRLRQEFEVLHMKQGESINGYFGRIMIIANEMRNYGETITDVKIVEKVLRTLTDKWNFIVCSIEEAKDIDELSVDALQSSLLVHEQKLTKENTEEHALTMGQSMEFRGRGRGRGGYRGERGRMHFNRATIECYRCHQLGHYQNECPSMTKHANYTECNEETEEMLLMGYEDNAEVHNNDVWFIDSGCSNHMCGNASAFTSLQKGFQRNVRLGNHTTIRVEGKGNVQLVFNGVTHTVRDVFFVPELKNNLLSVGQLQERGLAVLIKDNQCRIYHETKGLVIQSTMTTNRMFMLVADSNQKLEARLQTKIEDQTRLWHDDN